jgi:hypothetical protein
MEKLISHRRRGVAYDVEMMQEGTTPNALRRSQQAREQLQDLLERTDQKAGFVVTGIAFLGIFVQQGGYNATLTTIALGCYGVSFVFVCLTSAPRQWRWYAKRTAADLTVEHMTETLEAELNQSCRQEADLRAHFRRKNILLFIGFVFLIAGMMATQVAVFAK